jgi:peptide/nickel transport system ATP-binding protein
LINLPSGCSFHPRCPHVRDSHRRVEPTLEPLPDDPDHRVACLLDPATRKKLWRELQAGETPVAAREAISVEEDQA